MKIRLIVLSILISFAVYLTYMKLQYYANTKEIDSYLQKYYDKVTISNLDKTTLIFEGDDTKAALIFYPGANIEYTAYKPLMAALADKGIMCILFKMTLNIPILSFNAAKGIKDKFPEIKDWYIGGHSLGGFSSSMFLYSHKNKFKGLILFASYTLMNFSKSNLNVISILGSEDKIINMKKYNKNKKNLPKNFTEIIIDGGCHSYFGMSGLMKNDGVPKMTDVEQIEYTANELIKYI